MKRLTILTLALLLSLMTAVAVHADRPVVHHDEDLEGSFLVAECGDYEVWNYSVYHDTEMWYWNKDQEDPVKVQGSRQGVDRLYRVPDGELPSDYLVEGDFSYGWQCYPEPGYPDWTYYFCKVAGVFWNIQLPGEGTVFHESGLGIERWFLKDPTDEADDEWLGSIKSVGLEEFDTEALCEFFAQ